MKVSTSARSIVFDFEGWEQVWAVKKRLELPRVSIKKIKWHEKFVDSTILWRLAGTGAPGALYAGHFRGKGQKLFLYLKKPKGFRQIRADNVLDISLKKMHFDRVLISLEQKQADRLLKWWKKS